MKRLLASALAAAILATPVSAMMAPQYYQQARDEAPDVIVIRITGVDAPAGAMGVCGVRGQVTAVERGTAYRAGQEVRIPVHCASPQADLPAGGTLWTDMAALRRAQTARTFLRDGRPALDAFDILT